MKKFLIILVLFPTVCLAKGGTSSGGGNSAQAVPVTTEQVKAVLEGIKQPLIYFYNFFQMVGFNNQNPSTGPQLDKTHEKIFKSENEIFRIIDKVNPKVITSGNCFDDSGKETDASVVSTEPGTICFNATRLAQKLNSENLYLKSLALAVHEYSHFMGTTEEEAQFLQSYVESNLHNESIASSNVLLDTYKQMIGMQMAVIDHTIEQLEHDYELASQCTAISKTTMNSLNMSILLITLGRGLSPLSFIDQLKLFAAVIKQSNAVNACMESRLRGEYDSKFKDSESITLKELVGASFLNIPGSAYHVKYGDLKTAKQEIVESKELLSEIKL